jgi:hypothetical protein
MKSRLLALVSSLGIWGCTPSGTPALHIDGGYDAGVPVAPFTIYTLDSNNPVVLTDTIPQLAMSIYSDGTVGVAYFASNPSFDAGPNVPSYDVRYITWNGGSTSAAQTISTVQNVNGVSIAFQGSGAPAVAYLGCQYGNTSCLSASGALTEDAGSGSYFWFQAAPVISYASGTSPQGGGTWTPIVASFWDDYYGRYAGSPMAPPWGVPGTSLCNTSTYGTETNAGAVTGLDPALIFLPSSGNPVLAFRDVHYGQAVGNADTDYGDSDLRVFTGALATQSMKPDPNLSAIDCGSFSSNTPSRNPAGSGGHTQMVISAVDNLGALVEDGEDAADSSGSGVYFRKQQSDGSWAKPPANQGPFYALLASQGLANLGIGPSLATDPQVGYGIAVYDFGSGTLYYTQSLSATDPINTAWSSSTAVLGSGSQGWYPSLAFDPVTHVPSIAYYYCSNQGGLQLNSCTAVQNSLRLVTQQGTNWAPKIVDPAGGIQPKMGYLPGTEKRVIVYKDPFSGALKLAVEK